MSAFRVTNANGPPPRPWRSAGRPARERVASSAGSTGYGEDVPPARAQHPQRLAQGEGGVLGHVLERLRGQDEVEAPIRPGECLDVLFRVLDVDEGRAPPRGRGASARCC